MVVRGVRCAIIPYVERLPQVSEMLEKILSEIKQQVSDGVSVKSIALKTGVSASVLSRFLNGRRGISSPTAEKLIQTLKIKV